MGIRLSRSQAFDKIWSGVLIFKLKKLGISRSYIKLTIPDHTSLSSTVNVASENFENLSIDLGVASE